MKLTTLVENLVYQPHLVAEHGLSFYLDTGRRRILFDTGQSNAFIKNAKVLDIDISQVDALVISHGHYDHTGGLNAFLKENDEAPVYLKKEALDKKYNNSRSFIGTPAIPDEYKHRLIFVEEVTKIDEGVFIVPHIPIRNILDTSFDFFYTDKGKGMEQDKFDDELFLAITNNGMVSILSSCSHRGICNIAEEARKLFQLPVNLLTGGFHLKNAAKEQIQSVLNYLNQLKPQNIGICHCTGVENFPRMKREAHGNVFYNFTGNVVKI
jgi:7,8-dihydropterin-6-yl-methyl-4-(beta-D-ribofuranosyl)aminobenzene 5'-phosphate synthase